ncbi:hypothetical protein CALCODRAFT_518676 [Calocera cornea HHB12733]|uniref:Transcription factor TFIIIC triple barrel domain-containing protein n=1 Tax=Calocera cornea HHB12733 TaxID=1353952 RepID=A0A165EUZ4_9BASI|nr:hypothetical protein CALCODRAFT_518676 [Calocera cornea HHB12733]
MTADRAAGRAGSFKYCCSAARRDGGAGLHFGGAWRGSAAWGRQSAESQHSLRRRGPYLSPELSTPATAPATATATATATVLHCTALYRTILHCIVLSLQPAASQAMDTPAAPRPTSSLLGPHWTQVDDLSALDASYSSDEEIEYVTLDMGVPPHSAGPLQIPQYRLIGLDTPRPFLQLGNTIYEGVHQTLLGTEIVLRDTRDQDATGKSTKHVLPQHLATRRIRFREVTVRPHASAEDADAARPSRAPGWDKSVRFSLGRDSDDEAAAEAEAEAEVDVDVDADGTPLPLLPGGTAPRRSGYVPSGGRGRPRAKKGEGVRPMASSAAGAEMGSATGSVTGRRRGRPRGSGVAAGRGRGTARAAGEGRGRGRGRAAGGGREGGAGWGCGHGCGRCGRRGWARGCGRRPGGLGAHVGPWTAAAVA